MQFHNEKDKILIIDFGSQVTKLIARRIRELGVYSEIITPKELFTIKNYENIKGFILSGGPSTVTKKKFQNIPKQILNKNIPILGICYGLQLIAKIFGGKIKPSNKRREFGRAHLLKKRHSLLMKNFKSSIVNFIDVYHVNTHNKGLIRKLSKDVEIRFNELIKKED